MRSYSRMLTLAKETVRRMVTLGDEGEDVDRLLLLLAEEEVVVRVDRREDGLCSDSCSVLEVMMPRGGSAVGTNGDDDVNDDDDVRMRMVGAELVMMALLS
jgi:hypothetical protein